MWHSKKLHQVSDIQSGLWEGKIGPFTTALVLRNTNFTADGSLDYSNVIQLEVETKQLAKRQVIKNDIILEKSGGGDKTPVGRVCIHDAESITPFSLSNFTARIRVLDEQELDAQFLHRFLYFQYISGKTEPMQRHSTGIRNLQLSQYKEIDVPIPPLAEQQRIVSKLDAAFAEIERAIEVTQQNKKLCEELVQAAINEKLANLPTDCYKKFESTCSFVRGPFGGSLKKSSFVESGYAVYEQQHPINDQFDTFRYFVSEKKFLEMSRFSIKPNDVLMSCSGVTLGRVGIVPEGAPEGIINQALLKITPNNTLSSKYLQLLMRSEIFQNLIWSVSGGAAQPNVPPIKVIKELLLPIPNLDTQNELVDWANTLQSIEVGSMLKRKIDELFALKSAILAQELQPMRSEAA